MLLIKLKNLYLLVHIQCCALLKAEVLEKVLKVHFSVSSTILRVLKKYDTQ